MSDAAPPEGLARADLLRLAAVLAGVLAVVAALLVLTGGGGGGDQPARAQGTATGIVTQVNEYQLILAPQDGSASITFAVRPLEQRQFDLFHIEQHAAQRLSSVVSYEREGDTLYAVRVDDA